MILFPELSAFFLAAIAAVFIGLSKTGVPAMSLIFNALMVIAVPSKDAVGLVLLLLVCGDCFGVFFYRKHAQWRALIKLLPSIALGLLLGTYILDKIPNDAIKPIIGTVILIVFAVDIAQKRKWLTFNNGRPLLAIFFGTFAGVATVIGNAAGPIMAVYFLLLKFDKYQFMGTSALLFFIVNLSKIPLLWSIDVITEKTFSSILVLLPFLVIGAVCGRIILQRIPLHWFSGMITIMALGSSSYFIIEYAINQGWA